MPRLAALLFAALSMSAAHAAELRLVPEPSGVLLLDDGAPLGRVNLVAWDRAWASTSLSRITDVEGRLPGTLSGTLDLPGAAPGTVELTLTLEEGAPLHRLIVAAYIPEPTELQALAVELDLPLARVTGRAIHALPGESKVDVTADAFGGSLAAPALAADLGGGKALLFASTRGGAWLVQDNRGYGAQTVSLRQTLAGGVIAGGSRFRSTFFLGTVPAGEASAMAEQIAPSTDFDAARPAIAAQASGELRLLGPGAEPRGEVTLGVHNGRWTLRTQGESQPGSDVARDRRWYTGAVPVADSDGAVAYEQTVSAAGDGARIDYMIRRDQPLTLNSHHLALSLPILPAVGREVVLVGDETVSVTLPAQYTETHLARNVTREIRLWPDRPDGYTLTLDPAQPVLVQDNRAFNSNSLEIRVELGAGDPLPPGETQVALTIDPATPHQLLLDAERVTQTTDTTGWIAYPLPWDAAPVDLSFLNDAPAGKHGFLGTDGERFVFEDGTEARFWGTNFSAAANFPTHEQADAIARRLARFGVNIVRTHHADANWADPNFFGIGDRDTGVTTRFDPEAMDRFDYLLSRLKAEGIYIYLDQLVHRKFTPEDGPDAVDQLDNAAKPYSNFDPKLIELQQAFSRELLNHVNPYTGLAYKDDPAVVLMEFANENDLFTQAIELEPYRGRLEQQYREWARERGIEVPPGDVAFSLNQTPILQFLVEVQRDYYDRMHAFMRDLGVKIPLTGSNWSRNAALLMSLEELDFTDSHAYHGHPDREGAVTNQPFVVGEGTMMGSLSFNHLAGKPFFVSEWDTPWPNEGRAELPLWIAAIAGLQGWDGLTVYSYRHNATVPIDFISGAFETFNDPTRFGLFPAAALIYRRGDVARSEQQVVVQVPREAAATAPSPQPWSMPALRLTPEVHGVAMALGDAPAGADRVVPHDQRVIEPTDRVVSDTGEVARTLGDTGYGTIDTPRSQAAYGYLGAHESIALGDVALDVDTPFCTVAVSSLTDAPIATSTRLLVSAVGRAENTGMRYNMDRTRVVSRGAGPILIEPVTGTARIRTGHGTWTVRRLAPDGSTASQLTATAVDGAISIEMGPEAGTMYYLLEAE